MLGDIVSHGVSFTRHPEHATLIEVMASLRAALIFFHAKFIKASNLLGGTENDQQLMLPETKKGG